MSNRQAFLEVALLIPLRIGLIASSLDSSFAGLNWLASNPIILSVAKELNIVDILVVLPTSFYHDVLLFYSRFKVSFLLVLHGSLDLSLAAVLDISDK